MHQAIEEFLSARGTEYFLLDEQFCIVKTSTQVQSVIELPSPALPGEDIRTLFPELFGVEACLQAVLEGEEPQFTLAAVTRSTPQGETIYVDLQVVGVLDEVKDSPQLILLIENVTDRMALEQTLVQSTNEMSLMLDTLETSKKYINKVVGSIADALFVTDASGEITVVNRAAQTLFGYPEEELIGQQITAIVTDERFVPQQLYEYLMTRSEYVKDVEVTCRNRTGEQHLVAFSCSVLEIDPPNECEILYIGRDITDRRQAQYRFVTQYMVARIISLATTIEKAMPPVLKTIGETLDWTVGEFWLLESPKPSPIPTPQTQTSPPYLKRIATWSRSLEPLKQLLHASQPLTCTEGEGLIGEVWQRGKPQWIVDLSAQESLMRPELVREGGLRSGVAVPIESSQRIYGVILLLSVQSRLQDMDTIQALIAIATQLGQFIQRKQVEAALQESEERYRDLFENASDLIQSVDPQGKFLYVNRAWREAMGYGFEELEDIAVFDLLPPKEKIKFAKTFRQLLTGKKIEQMRTIFITKGGRQIVLEGTINCKQVEGKPVATRAIFRDITRRLATEEALRKQQQQSERLLLNILPAQIAAKLKRNPKTIAEKFEEVTVLFADIANFTEMAGRLSPIKLVNLLNAIFSEFDRLTELHHLEKIKTIGDAYMVVGGLPERRKDHAEAIADMALEMQEAIVQFNRDRHHSLRMRVGIHTGPVVAGVIGIKKFIYDLWGDTVNIASRMESHGLAGRIQVTQAVYDLLRDRYQFEFRGQIPIKGKGEMETYWLMGRQGDGETSSI